MTKPKPKKRKRTAINPGHVRTGRPAKRPSVWEIVDQDGATLEARITKTLVETGCSFKDAAEINGIDFSTLKDRQRTDAGFSTRLAHARLSVKTRTLAQLHAAMAAGNVRAMTFWLERVYRDEFGVRLYDDGSAAAAAAQAAAEAVFAEDVAFGDALRADPEAMAIIDRIARAAIATKPSAVGSGVSRASGEPELPDGAAHLAAQPTADRRRREADPAADHKLARQARKK